MSAKPTRREVLIGTASVAAGAVLPAASVAAVALPVAASVPVQPVAAVSAADYLGIYVAGCGRACDCDWYKRAHRFDCSPTCFVRKLGDKYVVYDIDNNVIGEADPGFKPLDGAHVWIAQQEYAREHGLPHPHDWPDEWHHLYEDDRAELLAIANSRGGSIIVKRIKRKRRAIKRKRQRESKSPAAHARRAACLQSGIRRDSQGWWSSPAHVINGDDLRWD